MMYPKENERRWFVFYHDQLLLVKDGNRYRIPLGREVPQKQKVCHSGLTLMLPEGEQAVALSVEEPVEETPDRILIGLRASYECLDLSDYKAAGKAFQIIHWDRNSHYCPVCGTRTELANPIMKSCPSCKNEIYPPISTAILVLIRKKDEILLVHARNFRGTFYGLVAGFLEVGETLEECVVREVREETGLTIRNIRYFGNQPWPYPSGLMVGFFADYESGEIKLQDEELSSGAFYSRENLPEIPRKLSLARKMIDAWLEGTFI